jgi:hypothetical protein
VNLDCASLNDLELQALQQAATHAAIRDCMEQSNAALTVAAAQKER